jgi:hypothetical protein
MEKALTVSEEEEEITKSEKETPHYARCQFTDGYSAVVVTPPV